MSHPPPGIAEPLSDDQFDATAWSLQRRVNVWFNAWLRESETKRQAGTDLIQLTERGPGDNPPPMTADPDGEWYEANGKRPESRPRAQNLVEDSFWHAVQPLYDFLHLRYQLAWTYSVLMLQANENFRGTASNLGVGDHFSARSEVIFTDGEGSEVRAGWHANQLPPFLVQQGLTLRPPFELISTYALNVRFLTDALPFTITRVEEDDERGAKDRRVVSVAPFYKLFENDLPELTRLVESAAINYSPEQGWGHGGTKSLEPIFAEIGERLKEKLPPAETHKIRRSHEQYLFRILSEGPDSNVIDDLRTRLSRPGGSQLALAQYLVLMSAVWPKWTRIMMIPHPIPVLSHPQPGGIVICEDAQSKRITPNDIKQIANLVSIAIWPWVSIQTGARAADQAMRNAALLGEVIRHDLRNSLSPIRVLLLRETARLAATDKECAGYLSQLNVLNSSLEGLSGLEDSPTSPEREEFQVMFGRLKDAFSGNPKASFVFEATGEVRTEIPRLYYAIFAELIRNASKHRPKNWTEASSPIVITAHQEGAELIITLQNVAAEKKIKKAVNLFENAELALSEQTRMNLGRRGNQREMDDEEIDELFKKGIGLVVNLVRHARGEIVCQQTDALGWRWLSVSIRIL